MTSWPLGHQAVTPADTQDAVSPQVKAERARRKLGAASLTTHLPFPQRPGRAQWPHELGPLPHFTCPGTLRVGAAMSHSEGKSKTLRVK